jgi:hypothetical protein
MVVSVRVSNSAKDLQSHKTMADDDFMIAKKEETAREEKIVRQM